MFNLEKMIGGDIGKFMPVLRKALKLQDRKLETREQMVESLKTFAQRIAQPDVAAIEVEVEVKGHKVMVLVAGPKAALPSTST